MLGTYAFWLGLLGGVIAEFIALSHYRKVPAKKRPQYLQHPATDLFFWAVGLGWILLGGFLGWIQARHLNNGEVLLPMQLGGTAPLFFERMFANLPDGEVGSVE